MRFAKPKLPRALLHTLTVCRRKFAYNYEKGGQAEPVEETAASFSGIVMPLSNEDWRLLPEGSYTRSSQKLYTDSAADIKPGDIIQDTYDGQKYTVKERMAHNTIHPMERFIVEGVVEK